MMFLCESHERLPRSREKRLGHSDELGKNNAKWRIREVVLLIATPILA